MEDRSRATPRAASARGSLVCMFGPQAHSLMKGSEPEVTEGAGVQQPARGTPRAWEGAALREHLAAAGVEKAMGAPSSSA